MRYVIVTLTLVLLVFATPLAASWWPAWSTTDIQMYVGDKANVTVIPTWSGLVDYGNGVHWTFASDNPKVATGEVRLDSALPKDFDITAVSPGVAHIHSDASNWNYVTIRVICPESHATIAVAAEPVVYAERGREVHLTVVTESANHAAFQWYLGKIGDTSHPIGGSSSEMTYIPDSYGSQYVWAEATTPCSTAHVQFRVDVYARQRSVRH